MEQDALFFIWCGIGRQYESLPKWESIQSFNLGHICVFLPKTIRIEVTITRLLGPLPSPDLSKKKSSLEKKVEKITGRNLPLVITLGG